MIITNFSETRRDECADFWWHLYKLLPYVHTPDGYQNVNSPTHIDPDYFLRRLDWGLSEPSSRWHGEVRNDTIFLAIDNEALVGMMICSVDQETSKGSILSAYMQRNQMGRHVAAQLVDRALLFFQNAGLRQAVAGPDVTKSMEVESPIHLALLDAGFCWTGEMTGWVTPDYEDEPYVAPEYGIFLGGSLADFQLSPEIKQKIETLEKTGISVEKYTSDQFDRLYRIAHEYFRERKINGDVTFVALHDGCAIGLLGEVETRSDGGECGSPRIMGGCVPHVVPVYRNKGIGKVLYHLGIEEVVKQGAQYGWTATGVANPARLIYQSVGYSNWYLAFNRIQKHFTTN